MPYTVPEYDQLTTDPNGPIGNAWGVFGPDDQHGTLNHLDDQTVASAAATISSGRRISLSLPMDFILRPVSYRSAFTQNLIKRPGRDVHDDEWCFNTQVSSQWDGFRHFGVNGQYYMGRTSEDFMKSTIPNSINHWREGIFGRGLLIDWYTWATSRGDKRDLLHPGQDPKTYQIPFSDLLACLAEQQDTQPQPGDILLVRTGWVTQYRALTPDDKESLHLLTDSAKPENTGVVVDDDLMRWLWTNRISCVACDAKSFETWNPKVPRLPFHERALAGWGMPIGELFDLDEVATECRKRGQWTFFFSSINVNVNGGVASPANSVAIF